MLVELGLTELPGDPVGTTVALGDGCTKQIPPAPVAIMQLFGHFFVSQ